MNFSFLSFFFLQNNIKLKFNNMPKDILNINFNDTLIITMRDQFFRLSTTH